MHRSIPLTFAFVASLVPLSTKTTAETKVYFSPSPEVPKALDRIVNSSLDSIDIAIYSLSDKTITDSFERAVSRDVVVRVLLHEANKVEQLATSLEAIGVDVRYTSRVMHHKFAIVDWYRVCTGSANWSQSSYSRYDDDLLVTDESKYVEAFRNEFELLWNNSIGFGPEWRHDPFKPFVTHGKVYFTSANAKPVEIRGKRSFRTVVDLPGECGSKIVDAIQSARSEILIATTHYRRFDIYNELLSAIQRGVKVSLLLDQQEYHSEPDSLPKTLYDEALRLAGADVRYKVYSRKWNFGTAAQMHAKYMIVDGSKMLTGSFNWSEPAELSTFDNLLLLNDRSIVSAYQNNFETIWTYWEGMLPQLLENLRSSEGRTPCEFAPMTLTGEQIQTLHAAYAGDACQ